MKSRKSRTALWCAGQSWLTIVAIVCAVAAANEARAATVTFTLVIDPNSAINGCVGCTLNGVGTWDLLVEASQDDNFGIASYKAALLNTTSILHRAPRALLSPDPAGMDPEPQPAGFTLLRSANGVNPIVASQDTVGPTPYLIRGFGQTPGSLPGGIHPATTIFPPTGQLTWGKPLLIAEGTYAGGMFPAFDLTNPSAVNVFTEATGVATQAGSILLVSCPLGGGCHEGALIVDDFSHVAALNEVVSTTMTGVGVGDLTWSGLQNISYTPMFGAPETAPGANFPPAWNPETQQFSWDTSGSSRGRYTWEVTATDSFGSENGLITIDVPFVPEPSTLSLFGVAILGSVGMIRRVRGSES